MSSFRSNLNSVSNTHERLITLKNRITTCFQHWCRKISQLKKSEPTPDSNNNVGKQPRYNHWLELESLRKYKNFKRSNNSFYKLKQALANNFQTTRKQANKNAQKIEIIANLLSSTWITAKISEITPTTNNTINVTKDSTTADLVNSNGNKMTIMDDTFLLIREEHPELDKEIRGILIARAQTGATIGQIKEDYRKNTGTAFPVFNNITDFLLCIPGVMAFCTERGTRIFSVQPTEKNKHIYDMVMNQKAPSERSSTSAYNNIHSNNYHNRHFLRSRDSGFTSYAANGAPPSGTWRSSLNRQQLVFQQQQYYQPPLRNAEEHNLPRDSMDDFHDNRNGSYRDNCQYLINRIYSGFEQNIPNKNFTANDNSFNNLNLNANNNPNDNAAQIDDAVYQANNERESMSFSHQPIQVENDIFKRPKGRAVRTAVVRSSSPSTGTHSSQNDSKYGTDSECEARLLDFPLLGDDFFLYMARMELKCKFKKYMKALQSGLCVSGQTIKAAIKRVSQLPYNNYPNRRIIVNIGSVDIMQGRPLVQIEHDYRNLINILNKRGLQPILTTLAPLANYTHDRAMKSKLERFNEFIKREGQCLLVIDIWARFVNDKNQTLFDCYQHEPRQVTGAKESYVFWNKIGRQRVLQLIESNLEY